MDYGQEGGRTGHFLKIYRERGKGGPGRNDSSEEEKKRTPSRPVELNEASGKEYGPKVPRATKKKIRLFDGEKKKI